MIRIRKEHGYPLHAPPHPIRIPGFYVVSAATYYHEPILRDISRRTNFEIRLIDAFRASDADVSGWVILPNHYHILIGVSSFKIIPETIKYLHGVTSFEWNQADGLSGQRRVWYRYVDRMIRNDDHYDQALNYIHYNPVKHRYVENAYDWIWSSLHVYYEDKGKDWLREKWKAHPPVSIGGGWDMD